MDEKLGSVAVAVTSPEDTAPTAKGETTNAPTVWRAPAPRRTMARKKVSTTIYIEPEQLELLKLLNERTKVPMAEYIREGIDLVLAKHQDKLPGQLPLDAAAATRRNPAGG